MLYTLWIKRGFLLALIVSSISCTQKKYLKEKNLKGFSYNQETKSLIAEHLGRVCLSGEGKGRLKFFEQKFLFSQEAIQNRKKYLWSLGLQLPVYGEEILRLKWKNAHHQRATVYGSFYKRLKQEVGKSKSPKAYNKLMSQFLHRLSLFLRLHDDLAKGSDNKWQCRFRKDFDRGVCDHKVGSKVHWQLIEDGVKFIFPISSKKSIVFEASNQSDTFYKRIDIALEEPEKTGPEKRKIGLSLFMSSCI